MALSSPIYSALATSPGVGGSDRAGLGGTMLSRTGGGLGGSPSTGKVNRNTGSSDLLTAPLNLKSRSKRRRVVRIQRQRCLGDAMLRLADVNCDSPF